MSGSEIPVPNNRFQQVEYFLKGGPKSMYILSLLRKYPGERLIVFTYWPAEQFLLASLLTIMGFPLGIITPDMSHAERSKIIAKFTDPGNSEIQVLLMSARGNLESLNLQGACHRVVVVDQLAFMDLLQALGRVWRTGQRFRSFCHVLCLDNSYDQVLLARHFCQAIRNYGAMLGNQPITEERTREILGDSKTKGLVRRLRKEYECDEVEGIMRADAILRASDTVCAIFGMRRERLDPVWQDETDYFARLVLPEERAFLRKYYPDEVADWESANLDVDGKLLMTPNRLQTPKVMPIGQKKAKKAGVANQLRRAMGLDRIEEEGTMDMGQ